MNAAFDVWSILFLIASVQGIFIAFLLFIRKKSANHYLAWLILSFSLMMGYYVSYWTGFNEQFPREFAAAQGLTFLLGPFLYFFLISDRNKALHFIPFAVYVSVFLTVPYLQRDLVITIIGLQVLFQITHLIIYGFLFLINYTSRPHISNGRLRNWLWHRNLVIAFVGYVITFLAYYVMVWTQTISLEFDYMVSAASASFIYYIGYSGFNRPEVLKFHERNNQLEFSKAATQKLLNRIKDEISKKQLYLDNELKLTKLATVSGISAHELSHLLNTYEGKNFTDFINAYRIDFAKSLLLEKADENIINIAYDSGFNNKVTFNQAFRKFTGTSPSAFRKKHLSEA